MIGLDHLRRLCTAGIYKTAIEGGVLIDTGVGVLVQGQDFRAGYIGHDGVHYQFYISESIVLRIDSPEAVCTYRRRRIEAEGVTGPPQSSLVPRRQYLQHVAVGIRSRSPGRRGGD